MSIKSKIVKKDDYLGPNARINYAKSMQGAYDSTMKNGKSFGAGWGGEAPKGKLSDKIKAEAMLKKGMLGKVKK